MSDYLETHRKHIDYVKFKKLGLPLGSGMVESACKWLIQQRFKGTGMRWSKDGFNHLLHLRLAWVNSTFDCYFSSVEVLNHIREKGRDYVADIKLNRNVIFKGVKKKLNEVAREIPAQDKKRVRIGEREYWYFTKKMKIPDVEHDVRIVLFRKTPEDQEATKALGTNRLTWEVTRILLVYRHRWTGTETFHRDGKQELGLGDCQVVKEDGQTRHVHLVSTAYSLLMRALHRNHPQDWDREKLRTIGEACRAVKSETLGKLVDWICHKAMQLHWSAPKIKVVLGIAHP